MFRLKAWDDFLRLEAPSGVISSTMFYKYAKPSNQTLKISTKGVSSLFFMHHLAGGTGKPTGSVASSD